MREPRTFVDADGHEYVMPVDVDPEYWVALDRLFEAKADEE